MKIPFKYYDYKIDMKEYKKKLNQIESQYAYTKMQSNSDDDNSEKLSPERQFKTYDTSKKLGYLNHDQFTKNKIKSLNNKKTSFNLNMNNNIAINNNNNTTDRKYTLQLSDSDSDEEDFKNLKTSISNMVKNPFLTSNNIAPKDLAKINYNPYKKREFINIDDQKLKELKELAFKRDKNSIRKTEVSKIKNAKYLTKLKRKNVSIVENNNENKEDTDRNKPSYGNLINNIASKTSVFTTEPSKKQLSSISNGVNNHKKLEFEIIDVDSAIKNNPLTFFQTYRNPKVLRNTDEKIFIDNQEFLRTNLNEISKKVLEKCNYSQLKNKNSKDSLRIGQGKAMITNGMTIAEFSKRYKLNP